MNAHIEREKRGGERGGGGGGGEEKGLGSREKEILTHSKPHRC